MQTGDSLNFQLGNYSPLLLSSLFDKQLNTYSLKNNLIYSKNFGNVFLGVNETFNSTVVKSRPNHIKDEQNFSFINEYNIAQNFKTGILAQSNIYSDDRNLSIGSASNHNASVYGKIIPADRINLIPFVGYEINEQVNETDRGALYGAEMVVDKMKINDLLLNGSMKFENEDISPRKNLVRDARINLSSKFAKNFNNSLAVQYSEKRKDFYFQSDTLTQRFFNITNNIQSRSEERYSIANNFIYSEPEIHSTFQINGAVLLRNIDRNTRYVLTDNLNASSFDALIEELRINLDGTYRYAYNKMNSFLRLQYNERQETHKAKRIEGANEIFYQERVELEKQKNNQAKQITLSGALNFDFTEKDRIYFSFLHRKLIYDTPSENNFDDRDELLSLMRLGYIKKLNSFFSFSLNTEVALNHVVYIFAERSSNNNYKRFIKLNTAGNYYSNVIQSSTSAEVSANYTVYDFEDLNPNFKSFSFRQFVLRDSTSIKLSKRLFTVFNGYIKLSEQGDFKWNDFKTRPSRFLEETLFIPKLVYLYRKLELGVGLRYFSLQTYKFNSELEKIKDKLYNSIGPLADISLRLNTLYFNLYGWFENIRNEDNTRRELANLMFKVNWNF